MWHTHLDEDGPTSCGFCGRRIRLALAEACWFCNGPLCYECWETITHCGHAEAYKHEREVRRALRGKAS